jgi:hypothetical protein
MVVLTSSTTMLPVAAPLIVAVSFTAARVRNAVELELSEPSETV